MRRKQDDSSHQPSGNTAQQALEQSFLTGIQFGHFYRPIEDDIDAFRKQEGCHFTLDQIVYWMGRLLEAKTIRERGGHPQLVPEVRQISAGTHQGSAPGLPADDQSADTDVHVQSRNRRTLSEKPANWDSLSASEKQRWYRHRAHPNAGERSNGGRRLSLTARKAIGKAQRERWARYHAAKDAVDAKQKAKRAHWRLQKQKERVEKGSASGIAGYWAKMTPEKRAKEMRRRRAITEAKKKAKYLAEAKAQPVNGAQATA